MLNQESLAAVAAARIDDHCARPLYEGFGFAQIPSMVRSLLTDAPTSMPASVLPAGDRPRQVVVILVDGFGWSFFERYGEDLPFLGRFVADGVVSKLSSQFPSTTAAQITTLHTGQPVGQSGLFEWSYYEPVLDALFMPLPALTVEADGPRPVVPPEGFVYPTTSLYGHLGEAGVTSYCYQSIRYAASTYSKAVTGGSVMVPFRTLPEAVVQLAERVNAASSPTYHCVYFDVIDSISHVYGPNAKAVRAEIRALFRLLEDELASELTGTDSLVVVTADHGHIEVWPERTHYVDDLVAALPAWMRTMPDGRPAAPAGSPRDLFLYVRDSHVPEAIDALESALDGAATVHRVATLVDDGFFGSVQPALRERLSTLVVLPRPGESVWWSGGGRFVADKRGHHGGLSREELEIPLLVWRP